MGRGRESVRSLCRPTNWGPSCPTQYLKLDGCNNAGKKYETGYPAMGAALQKSGRNITYSCSWPAYIGSDESVKPFDEMIAAGCNSWRNWHGEYLPYPALPYT